MAPMRGAIFHVIESFNKNIYLKLDTFPIVSYIIHSVVYFSCVLVILFFLITGCADLCTQHAETLQCVTLNFGSEWMQPLIHAKVNRNVTSNTDKISFVRSLIASDSLACDLMGAASFRAKLIDYKFSIQRKFFAYLWPHHFSWLPTMGPPSSGLWCCC